MGFVTHGVPSCVRWTRRPGLRELSLRWSGVEFQFGLDCKCSQYVLVSDPGRLGSLINGTQCSHEPATRPTQRASRVEADARVPHDQRVGTESGVLERIRHDKQFLTLDRPVAERVSSIHRPAQWSEEGPQKLLVLGRHLIRNTWCTKCSIHSAGTTRLQMGTGFIRRVPKGWPALRLSPLRRGSMHAFS
jgi:hypothetical protein